MLINTQQFEAAVTFIAENNPHYTQAYKDKCGDVSDKRSYADMCGFDQHEIRLFVRYAMIDSAKALLNSHAIDPADCVRSHSGYTIVAWGEELWFLVDPSVGKPPSFQNLVRAGLNFLKQEAKGTFV